MAGNYEARGVNAKVGERRAVGEFGGFECSEALQMREGHLSLWTDQHQIMSAH